MFQAIDDTYGRFDALFNNAGVLAQQMRVAEMSADRIYKIMATNFVGSMLCARKAVRRMSTARGGAGGPSTRKCMRVVVSTPRAHLSMCRVAVNHLSAATTTDQSRFDIRLLFSITGGVVHPCARAEHERSLCRKP